MDLNRAAANAIFAGNRSRGDITLRVDARDGASVCKRLSEIGCLRLRFPNCEGRGLEGVILNTAGGIASGDRLAINVAVGVDAELTLTTAAAEKAYRSLGLDATIDVRLSVAPGGSLRWLPQETILFDHVSVRRSIDVELAERAQLMLAESIVFGRSAMGETVQFGTFFDRWRVRRAGKLVFAETTRLDGEIARMLAQPAAADGGQAIAIVLMVPGDESAVSAVRALNVDFRCEVGASAWNGLAVVRLCAKDAVHLRRDLALVLSACGGGRRLPRLWVN
jgi:urease accessory protein